MKEKIVLSSYVHVLKDFSTRIESFLFYLLIACIPIQLGRHFWPDFSFVAGIRIDYLSPTLYLTDLLLIVLFIVSFDKLWKAVRSQISSFKFQVSACTVFFIFLAVGIFLSENPLAGLCGFLKLLEMLFFGWYVCNYVKTKENGYSYFTLIFSTALFVESLIGLAQFSLQRSVGGFLYFLGERTFNAQTPGIADASISGQLVLRPYATFPHPNLFAAFLLLGMIFVSFNLKKNMVPKLAILFLGSVALFATLSRVAIFLWVAYLFTWWFRLKLDKAKAIIAIVLLAGGILLLLSPVGVRFFSTASLDESIVVRQNLNSSSFAIFLTHPLFGVGLNNFYNAISHVQRGPSVRIDSYLQPVHNIFLLVLSETGLPGFFVFVFLLFVSLGKAYRKKFRAPFFAMIACIIVLGLFDHYFLTLQQGLLLFTFVVSSGLAL